MKTHSNPFWGEAFNAYKDAKVPWLDSELILASYRRNMELMNTTQQIAAETTKSLMQLQSQYIKQLFEQMNEQAKANLSMMSVEEKEVHHSDAAKATLDQAVEHAREVNSVISKSNDKLMTSFQKRFKEGVDESVSLAKKAKRKD